MSLDLGQLEAFVQVANQRSFSRAAEALFLTQPSVTARIQALERDLGERLFERSGRGVRLTEVGACFLPHAERVLQALNAGRDAIDSLRNLQSGSLILASATTVSTYMLPGLLKTFRARLPAHRSLGAHRPLGAGASDAAAGRSPGRPRARRLPPGHRDEGPDRGRARPRRQCDARAHRRRHGDASSSSATTPSSSSTATPATTRWPRACSASTASCRARRWSSTPWKRRRRWSKKASASPCCPRIALERELNDGSLREIAIAGMPNPTRQIALISRRSRPLGPVAQAFVDIVQEIFNNERAAAASAAAAVPVAAAG